MLYSQRRRPFEKLWGETARLLQRQPGYTYTLMFRRVPFAEADQGIEQKQTTNKEVQQHTGGRRGIGAGLEVAVEEAVTKGNRPILDYVEMRVWESEGQQQNACKLQLPVQQKMCELGVEMYGGPYRRVFDDALVRLIQ
ncbi:hypothetical protein cyc_03713 [Cyclospora cayetanensis]|uniref:Uncharacterized protein n=1 Tax=Cyclospora cayetanensis TaxID=88456 RepID=A0A1D3CXA3_9EIME|nr:hypothetical protein cyc_03713 [Cyclospora cayetanensis]